MGESSVPKLSSPFDSVIECLLLAPFMATFIARDDGNGMIYKVKNLNKMYSRFKLGVVYESVRPLLATQIVGTVSSSEMTSFFRQFLKMMAMTPPEQTNRRDA